MEKPFRLLRPDGAAIAYDAVRLERPRPLVVFVHGMASNMTRWSELFGQTTLRQSWDLLRLDLRGHGRSTLRGRIGMQVWGEDLIAILDAEGYDRAVVAGHCLGANFAVHFAQAFPARVRGLVLVEPMPLPAQSKAMRVTSALSPFFSLLVILIRALNHLGLQRRQLASVDLEELDALTRAAMQADGNIDAMTARYAAPWADLKLMATASYLQDLIALLRPLPALSSVDVPVLALTSKGARFADPLRTERELSALRRLTLRQLDALHWIPTEQPLQMRVEIEQWCARLLDA